MKKRIEAFKYAFEGVYCALKNETHLKIHFGALVIVLFVGWYFQLSEPEWLSVIICAGVVIAAEMINTAIERLCDFVSTEKRPEIKYIKDVSAGAVLILALMSLSISLVILFSHLHWYK